MRDRLIESLFKTGMVENRIRCSIIADEILADGWMRPPCKVGDTVYRIVEMSTGVMMNSTYTIKRFIRAVEVTKNNFFDVCENFGKTVFLAEEEAEQALEGGVQG